MYILKGMKYKEIKGLRWTRRETGITIGPKKYYLPQMKDALLQSFFKSKTDFMVKKYGAYGRKRYVVKLW